MNRLAQGQSSSCSSLSWPAEHGLRLTATQKAVGPLPSLSPLASPPTRCQKHVTAHLNGCWSKRARKVIGSGDGNSRLRIAMFASTQTNTDGRGLTEPVAG